MIFTCRVLSILNIMAKELCDYDDSLMNQVHFMIVTKMVIAVKELCEYDKSLLNRVHYMKVTKSCGYHGGRTVWL